MYPNFTYHREIVLDTTIHVHFWTLNINERDHPNCSIIQSTEMHFETAQCTSDLVQ